MRTSTGRRGRATRPRGPTRGRCARTPRWVARGDAGAVGTEPFAPRAALVVCGSRALADAPCAERWARRRILAALRALAGPNLCVVAGGARGPDAWAREAADVLGLAWVEYRLDGHAYLSDGRRGPWTRGARPRGPRLPLARNAAM